MMIQHFVFMFAAALCLRGPGALLNFPKLASSLPRPLDLSDKCIQAASNEAAKRFAREIKSQRRLYRLHTTASSLQASTSDQSPQSQCKLEAIAASPNSMAPHRRLALAPCKIEMNNYSGEQYFFSNNLGEPARSLPLLVPPTPNIAREHPVNRMFRSTPPPESREGPDIHHPLTMNHAVCSSFPTSFGSKAAAPQMLLPKVEEIDYPPSAMAFIGEEFVDRSRSRPENLPDKYNSAEERCSLSAGEILLCTESGLQEFMEEDMMFNNTPGFVASMYAGMCLVPPQPISAQMFDGDEGASNSTWELPRLWSF